MTMFLRLSEGWNAKIEGILVVFENKDRNYPIKGVPDDFMDHSSGYNTTRF